MDYKEILKQAGVKDVEIAFEGVELFDDDELEDRQTGYAIDGDGNDLTGTEEGDWRTGWVVIGYDVSAGDPIFIDAKAKNYPVYTAMHGERAWDPALFSPSLEKFLSSLTQLKRIETEFNIFQGTGDAFKLRNMMNEIQENIIELNKGCNEYLWDGMFERISERIDEIKDNI